MSLVLLHQFCHNAEMNEIKISDFGNCTFIIFPTHKKNISKQSIYYCPDTDSVIK
jgi:hypothetical protein